MKGSNFSLKPFPSDHKPPSLRVAGRLERKRNILFVSYSLNGSLTELLIPAPAKKSERRQALWEETCLEFFLGISGSDSYREFNLSPSGHWNVYLFTSYRKGMQEDQGFTSLPFSVSILPNSLQLSLQLDLKNIVPAGRTLEIAVSAVIKDINSTITYWALTHPGPQPDFHSRESFIIRI